MSLEYLLTWLMVLLRSLGVIMLLPTLAGRQLPVTVRVALGACLATLVAGIVAPAQLPLGQWDLARAAAGEVILGLVLGFIGRLTLCRRAFGALKRVHTPAATQPLRLGNGLSCRAKA